MGQLMLDVMEIKGSQIKMIWTYLEEGQKDAEVGVAKEKGPPKEVHEGQMIHELLCW